MGGEDEAGGVKGGANGWGGGDGVKEGGGEREEEAYGEEGV